MNLLQLPRSAPPAPLVFQWRSTDVRSGDPQSFPARLEHFNILDVLRFVLAFWVSVGHLGVFPLMGAHPAPGLPHYIERFLNSTVWGMPAVMAFFVISGFCIHYPLHQGRELKVVNFYLRRYIRILIPVAIVIAYLYASRGPLSWVGHESVLFTGTLWSLLCEEFYYALYPTLRWLQRKMGWTPILLVTSAISIVMATQAYSARDWFDVGAIRTAIILYPVWIMGCVMAEQVTRTRRIIASRQIWLWRVGAWSAMWVSEALNFHSPISQVHTMLFVGIVAYFWIRAEIDYHRSRPVIPWLRRAGAWSYSLYLVHPLVYAYFYVHPLVGNAQTRVGWTMQLGIALVLSYGFYLLVERPAHRLAKRLGRTQVVEQAA